MKMSQVGLEMLIHLEGGHQLQMYHDQRGLPTIGVGHLLTRDELSSGKIWTGEREIKWHEGLTPADSAWLLHHDLAKTEMAVELGVRVPITQPQFDALVSFVFNIGGYVDPVSHIIGGAFSRSSLLEALNRQEYAAIPGKMREWKYSGGVVMPVLVARRETEIHRWHDSGGVLEPRRNGIPMTKPPPIEALAALLDALKTYGQHRVGCPHPACPDCGTHTMAASKTPGYSYCTRCGRGSIPTQDEACDCGFEAALAEQATSEEDETKGGERRSLAPSPKHSAADVPDRPTAPVQPSPAVPASGGPVRPEPEEAP